MKTPLIQLIIIQLKEFYREPGIFFWGIAFPILTAWGLGIAFTHKGDVAKNIAVIENTTSQNILFRNFLVDAKKTEYSLLNTDKTFEKIFTDEKLGKIKFKFIFTSYENAIVLLKRGTTPVILEVADNKIKYYFDPINNESELIYLQLSSAINNNKINNKADEVIPLTKIGTRYIDFLIPGMIAMGIMMSTMWGISYALIEKRSKKLMRRLIATPMKKSSFLISHFIARFLLCSIEAALLFLFAHYFFEIKVEGSIFALLLIFISGVIAFTGLAILVSSRTAKTEIGNGLINAVVMPMMILSGIYFSYHNFPEPVIPIIQKLPLTMLADGIRSIFIEGAVLKDVLTKIIYLIITGIVFFITGLKIYKWY
ncbi:ABC transporter permease [Candidatus Poribacteria bacterium]|nr:ABC transporter permease [Candidatus Poribacteria bacterium]